MRMNSKLSFGRAKRVVEVDSNVLTSEDLFNR